MNLTHIISQTCHPDTEVTKILEIVKPSKTKQNKTKTKKKKKEEEIFKGLKHAKRTTTL